MKVVSLKERAVWLNYLNQLPPQKRDIYYTPEYYKIYEDNGDGEAWCFIYEQEGQIALYPFLKNPLPYHAKGFDIQGAYGYNGVVSNSEEQAFIANFYASFEEYCQTEGIIAEFTRFNPLLNNQTFSEHNMQVLFNRNTVAVGLEQDWQSIRQNFSSSVKRNIKKALRNGLEVFTSPLHKAAFKEIYKETMLRVNSNEYLFFNELYFDQLFEMDELRQVRVEYNNEIIASAVCFAYNDYFHYHLGASKTDYLHLRPNDLIFKTMIALAHEENCKYIHLGGGTSSHPDDTLLRYKAKFSKEKQDFYIGKKIHDPVSYNSLIELWRKENKITEENDYKNLLRYRDNVVKNN